MTTIARWQGRPWRRPARHLELGAVLLVLAVPALLAFALPQSLGAPTWVTAAVGALGIAAAYAFAIAGAYLLLDSHHRLVRIAAWAAVPLGLAGVLVHNLFYGITGVEEGVFFLLAVLYAPAILLAALARLFHKAS